PSSRDRLRALDRDQHLPTGGGPPVHLGRQVYGGPVPHVLLAGAGSAAPAAGPGGGYVRGVPGNFRGVVLLVATGCLTNLDAPGRIRTCDQQLRRSSPPAPLNVGERPCSDLRAGINGPRVSRCKGARQR